MRFPRPEPARSRRPGPVASLLSLPCLLLGLLGGLAGPVPTVRAEEARAAEDLPAQLRAFLDEPAFRHATWGVVVGLADDDGTLFAAGAHTLLKPASNAKLFTGALALEALGPEFRIRTDLIPAARVDRDGVLRGDLVLYGRGDFSMAARFHDGDGRRSLEPVVEALKRAGIRRIQGALVADDSYFPGPPFGTGWTWDDLQYYYGAAVGALSVDDNVIDLVFRPGAEPGAPGVFTATPTPHGLEFRTERLKTVPPGGARTVSVRRDPGSRVVECAGTLPVGGADVTEAVTVPEPGLHFVEVLRERLREAGIPVRGGVRHAPGAAAALTSSDGPGAGRDRRRAALPPRISVESRPLSQLVVRMMKPSQNLYAQLLLLQAGMQAPGGAEAAVGGPEPAPATAEALGLRALGTFLTRAGIPAEEVRLDDGSGLSRSALVTPSALVRLLRWMDRGPVREDFLEALPVAGVDGTLRNRLKGTRAEGNLRAKTGSLRYVSTLSGFVTNASGRRLVFSAMLNAYAPPAGGPTGSQALDRLVGILIDAPLPAPGSPGR